MAPRAQWSLMLRRAYGIPDGVSDTSAETVIARIFAEEHRSAGTMQMVPYPDQLVRQVIHEVLGMLEESVFDLRLLPEEFRRYLEEEIRNQDNLIWREELLNKLRDTDNWPRHPYAPPIAEVIAIAEAIIEKVCDYHVDNPELIDITKI